MALGAALTALGSYIASNKLGSLAVASTGLSLLDRLRPNPAQDMVNTIIQDQFDNYNRLNRQSRGNFTPSEVHEIRQANQGRVNRVASSVAQRGLGTSEAGVDFITQAQQAPFAEAQRSATLALPQAGQAAFNIGNQFTGDQSFSEDLTGLFESLTLLQGLDKDPDPEVDGAIGDLAAIASPEQKRSLQQVERYKFPF